MLVLSNCRLTVLFSHPFEEIIGFDSTGHLAVSLMAIALGTLSLFLSALKIFSLLVCGFSLMSVGVHVLLFFPFGISCASSIPVVEHSEPLLESLSPSSCLFFPSGTQVGVCWTSLFLICAVHRSLTPPISASPCCILSDAFKSIFGSQNSLGLSLVV